MNQPSMRIDPPYRPEFEYPLLALAPAAQTESVREPLSLAHRLLNHDGIRKILILAVLAMIWEMVGRWQDNELLLPTFTATIGAMWADLANGQLPARMAISLSVLLQGYALGVILAFFLTTFAISTRLGRDVLSTLTSMFNPLPAIALLPLALMWFGLGTTSLLFVLVHSVMWPLALNTFAGFQSVPQTLRMAGQNYGLRGLRFVWQILIPAALPSIVSGLKVGWAFAWRTLIAAEMVFGASSGQGGLGWYVFQHRNELETAQVFAGLVMVVILGLVVENLVFTTLEKMTVRRWGTQQ
ncbi:MAG: ABC transporter permease [Advenella sp.]|uniref:ABC transporter permease n=1 Tax=unclassified Advenella TaxID=2685285 RepID=UPI001D01E6EC|nr:ABC transporter permease [Advenella sp. FME57]